VDGTRTRERQRITRGKQASASTEGTNGHESSPFAPIQTLDLEAAIASITRALATASGDTVAVLARERAALRAELELAGGHEVLALRRSS
jgi:hypothetical protein